MLTPLPIDPLLPSIASTVSVSANVILTATPGAGKTTRLPPELLHSVSGKILVLQPRRMAAVGAAYRVAEERGWTLGREVGYQVRFDSKVSSETRLIFMTDALALRRLMDDPELSGVDLVVIDEFHERNLHQDIMLGALSELQALGREIKLLVMSATLDTDRLARFLPGAQVVDVPGKVYPLEIRHSREPLSTRTDFDFIDRVVGAVSAAEREGAGDILVFLPGVGEIHRVRDRLQTSREVQILHGSLRLEEQRRVLRRSESPRVILSTNVAEASVTVDGVDYVIDSGLARVLQTNAKTGFSQLELSRIALFNARQRSGRAARQKEGVSVRLWTSYEETTQAEELEPECQRVDLSQTLLWLAHLGVSDFRAFAWFDHPPGPLLQLAIRSLRALGALDESNRLTDLGRKLIRYPLPPRLGALMAFGEERGRRDLAARICALLSERDLLDDARNAPTTRYECDLMLRLELLEDFESGRARHLGVKAQNVLDVAAQLGGKPLRGFDESDVRRLLLASQRDRLCRRRGKSERALMVGGRGVKLAPESQVKSSEFFVALQGMDLAGQPDTSISIACGLSKDFILRELGSEIQVREDIHYDEEKEQFYSRRARFLDDLPVEEAALTPVSPDQVGEKLVDVLLGKWDWLVERNERLGSWMARWRFVSERESRFQDLLSDEVKRQMLEMAAYGQTRVASVLEQDLVAHLETVIGREAARELNELAPLSFTAPTGFQHKIDYSEGHSAFVDVRLQEMFGLPETPKILAGRVPLTFRLLGPNYRPVQVTADLASFWKNGYPEVRKDLRARYPKHSWPEDPLTAKPEAKGQKVRRTF